MSNLDYLKKIIIDLPNNEDFSLVSLLLKKLQNQDIEFVIITTINSLLSVSKTRAKGFELLNGIVPEVSQNALNQFAIGWTQHCTVHGCNDDLMVIKLQTLTILLKRTHDVPNYNKTFLSSCITDLIKICFEKYSMEVTWIVFEFLIQCLKRYPTFFGNQRDKIYAFFEKYLNEEDEKSVRLAGIAFHYVNQTGTAGVNNINYINNYFNTFKKLCMTIHCLYDEILENIKETEYYDHDKSDIFQFEHFSPKLSSQQIIKLLGRRIKNCVTYLKIMLIKDFQGFKKFIPKLLLDIITRGLAVHVCMDQSHLTVEQICLSSTLTQIQISLFKLFYCFITNYISSILPFSQYITKLLMGIMKRNRECNCFKTDKIYLENYHQTLNEWIIKCNMSLQSKNQKFLLETLMNGIFSGRNKPILLSTAPNKKKKTKVVNGDTNIDYPSKLKNEHLNKPLIYEFLKTLEILFTYTHLDPETLPTIKKLYKHTLKNLFEIHNNDKKDGHPINSDITYQLGLYKLLIAFYQQKNVPILPPIQLVNRILNVGFNHHNREISLICFKGLNDLEKISQPVCAPLDFNADIERRDEQISLIGQSDCDLIADNNIQDISGILDVEMDKSYDNLEMSVDIDGKNRGDSGKLEGQTVSLNDHEIAETEEKDLENVVSIRNGEINYTEPKENSIVLSQENAVAKSRELQPKESEENATNKQIVNGENATIKPIENGTIISIETEKNETLKLSENKKNSSIISQNDPEIQEDLKCFYESEMNGKPENPLPDSPPIKKSKPTTEEIDSMLNSFEDIVQE